MSTRASAMDGGIAVRPRADFTIGRNRLMQVGVAVVAAMIGLALFADLVSPCDPTEMKVADALKPPSRAHLVCTDRFGRDVLSRTIHGTRIALGVALSSIAMS